MSSITSTNASDIKEWMIEKGLAKSNYYEMKMCLLEVEKEMVEKEKEKVEETQYDAMCDNECGTQLTENEHIHCLSRGDEEMTFCTVCRDDNWEDLQKEGWICCDDDCE